MHTIEKAATPSPPLGRLHGDFLCRGTLAGAFAFFTYVSWRTWPDILIDFGNELYIPWRLCCGDRLYQDIAFGMGPLSQHVNALLFRLWGASLSTLIGANLAILAAIVVMLDWIFRRLGLRGSATFVGLFFLAVFAFAQYRLVGNYNYVCPYRHEVTHGLALGLANLICLVRLGETRHRRWLMATGFCLGLIALTKAELLLPAVIATAMALPMIAWSACRLTAAEGSANQPLAGGRSWLTAKRLIQCTAVAGAMALVPVAIALAALASSLGWKGAGEAVFVNYRLAVDSGLTSRSGFYSALSGFDRPYENAASTGIAALLVLGVTMAAIALSVGAERVFSRASRTKVWAVAVGIVAAMAGLRFATQIKWSALPAALPVLLPGMIAVGLCQTWRGSACAGSSFSRLLMAVYAIGLLPKILLHVDWGHYGFVLAMPGTLLFVHIAIHAIPAWLQQRTGSGTTFRALAVGLLSACALFQTALWGRVDGMKTLAIGKDGDTFYVDPRSDDRSLPTLKTLEYLQRVMRDDETLVVVPEGAMLNYLLRKRNPTPFLIFNPWEFDAQGGEERVTESLIRTAPDYIVIVTLDMSVHGRGEFGNPQYGGRILAFIEDKYELVGRQVSAAAPGAPPTFQATIFKLRKSRI